MNEDPNPYARLLGLLDPARVRHLTSNVARIGRGMACLFTTVTQLDVDGTFAASMDPEKDRDPGDDGARARFRAWAAEHGLTPEIVREVEEAGDRFEADRNYVEACERRYYYVRGWLTARAHAFEAERKALAPPTRPVHVYDFKVVRRAPLSDAQLDELAVVFEEGAPVRVRVIPDGPGCVEDASVYELDDWFDGEGG